MKISSEAKIGIIVTIAIVVTIWGLNFLKGRNILQRVHNYYAVFQNIGGLEKNSKIFINGYHVGQVGDIVFSHDGRNNLIVSLGIEKDYRLPEGSTALLYESNFMGTKAIEVKLGSSDRFIEPGDTLPSRIRTGIVDRIQEQISPVTDRAEDLILRVDSFVSAMNSVFGQEQTGQFKSTIRRLDKSSEGLEELLAENGKLTLMITHLESVTRNLRDHNEKLAAVMDNMEAITDSIARSELKATINNANRTLAQTRQITEKINQGEGTLGMLVSNDTLYRNLSELAGELDLLLKDLQEHPKKYVNVSVFGRSDRKNKK